MFDTPRGSGARDSPADRRVITLLRQRAGDLSQAKLAKRLGMSEDRIQRVLRTQHPARITLDELVQFCDALHVGRGELIAALWPDQTRSDVHAEIERLRQENRALTDQVSLHPYSNGATASLLHVMRRSRNWAYTVTPQLFGPDERTAIHVANQVRVQPRLAELRDLDHVGLRRAFLDEFGGLPTDVVFLNPYSYEPNPGEAAPPPERDALLLRAAVYTAQSPTGPDPVHLSGAPGRGIVVAALRGTTRRLIVAATVARALGWAHTSTRAFGTQHAGVWSPDPRRNAFYTNLYGNATLAEFLRDPPDTTVINHLGTPVLDPDSGEVIAPHALTESLGGGAPFVVLLSESDRSLAASVSTAVNQRGDRTRFTFEQLRAWRDDLRDAVQPLVSDGGAVVIDTDLPWAEGASTSESQRRISRWNQAARRAREALTQILMAGGAYQHMPLRDSDARRLLNHQSPTPWY